MTDHKNQNEEKVGPRENRLEWDEYFMGVCLLSSQKSPDPNTQVGACIVDSKNCIIGTGYNGMPRGCSNNDLPFARYGKAIDTKYFYMCHGEINAINNSDRNRLSGSTMYTTLFPCNECAKSIINNFISEVVYLDDKYHNTASCKAARKMFELAGIKTREFKSSIQEVTIRFC